MRTDPLHLPQALALAAEYEMFPRGKAVVLAVSGGRDSMTLLHWAAAHREDWEVRLLVGHYHHGMRGEQADRDARRVAAFCTHQGIPFFQELGDVYGHARAVGKGVEEVGRTLRYAFLEALAAREGAALIATAHNADDNAETLLLHLARGAGLQGLTGIPPRRGKLVRPLLTTTRAEIDAYADRAALDYGDDATNLDDAYARNRLRHRVTPVMESINPRYVENVSAAIRLLRKDNEYLNAQAAQLLLLARQEEGRITLPAQVLAQRPFPIAVRAARQLLTEITGQTQFGERHLRALLALAAKNDPSGEVHLPYGAVARREYQLLILEMGGATSPPAAISLSHGVTPWGPWQVTVTGPAEGLVLRPRAEGDTLHPEKRSRKTLKKWMIEKKIPRHIRDTLPVVADDSGVLAAAGLGENTDHPLFGTVRVVFTLNVEKE